MCIGTQVKSTPLLNDSSDLSPSSSIGNTSRSAPLRSLKKIHFMPFPPSCKFACEPLLSGKVLQRERQTDRHACTYSWISLQSKTEVKLASHCFTVSSSNFSSGNYVRHQASRAAARTNLILGECQRQKRLNENSEARWPP